MAAMLENPVQPDMKFVATANLGIFRPRAIFGTPDLLMALISPSAVRRDRQDQKAFHFRFGIKKYRTGDPAHKSMEILALKAGQYELHGATDLQGNGPHRCSRI